MKNNNGAFIRKLSDRSLKNNRMRNIFAVLAIILTGILFTAVFSLTSGAMQVAQESTMREVGGKFHAGLKGVTGEQYEKITADPMIKRSSYTIILGVVDNILEHQGELRYLSEDGRLQDLFIGLEEGHLPVAENEIIVDTFTLDEFGLPHALGVKVPLAFSFMGETIEEEFEVCGWYQGDPVSHASELFISESYWMKLKGSRTDEDMVNWKEMHPEDNGAGLMDVNLFFDKEHNLEEKVQTVIRNAGYEPGTEVAYGVNWAYMSSRVEAVDPLTFFILFGAVAVILVTGYLIIYNVFQISVISDIRFYGLLKTIGTTKRQIRRLVMRQAVMLSGIGIPVGLAIGYRIGKLTLPFALSIMDYSGMEISLKFDPWILVAGAGFSMLTVCLSCRKPGKVAGSVSPIEAVKYTEAGGSGISAKKRKKKSHTGNPFSMALSNLGRNKRSTAVVITAISLSIILLAIIMTAVGSFRIDSFLEIRIAGDYMLGNINIISGSPRSADIEIEPEFLALADSQAGVEERQEMWVHYSSFLQMDDKALERFRQLEKEGRLRQDPYVLAERERMLRGEKSMNGYLYGYDVQLLSRLNVLDGTLDVDKFLTGDYILLTQILGDGRLPPEEHVYHVGDRVTMEWGTKDSEYIEFTDASGETTGFEYKNLAEKEYEVMAIVEIPSSMNLGRYTPDGCDRVLPLSEVRMMEGEADEDKGSGEESGRFSDCFMVSYRVEDADQPAFEAAIRAYTDHNTQTGYQSKDTLRGEFEGMITVIATLGIALAAVIALVGILNFINAVITQIISRKREFAMLQSIGMTTAQLQKTLICEGISYIVIAGGISFVLGSVLSWAVLRALNNVILFFEYRFQIMPFVIMMPILVLVAILAPVIAYRNLRKKSIVERLRESE